MKEVNSIERFGDRLIEIFHLVGLFVIGGTIVWSATHEYIDIMSKSHAGLDHILLLLSISISVLVLRYGEKRFVTGRDAQSTGPL